MIDRNRVRLTIAFLLMVGCTSTPLALPDPVLGLDDKNATRSAILMGMASRGWVMEEEVDQRILARIHVRHHVAKVWVDYGGRQIEFSYGGSEGLDCHRGNGSCSSIHRSSNRWARNLALDISREVTKQRAQERTPSSA